MPQPILIYSDFLRELPHPRKEYPYKTSVATYMDRTKREGFSLSFYGNINFTRLSWTEGAQHIFEDIPTEEEVREAMYRHHTFQSDTLCRKMFAALGISEDKAFEVGSYFSMGYEGKLELSYVPKVRLQRMFAVNTFPHNDPYDPPVIPSMNVSAGRFLRKLFPDATDAQIEDMVDKSKSFFYDTRIKLEEVTGERVLWAYLEDNYDWGFDLGSLANSCMRYESCQEKIAFFANEPKVKLLLATRGDGDDEKVVGRVLIWTLDNGKRAMEYEYCGGAVRKMFEAYAKEHDILQDEYLSDANDVVITLETWPKNGMFPSLDSFSYRHDEQKKIIYGYNSNPHARRY